MIITTLVQGNLRMVAEPSDIEEIQELLNDDSKNVLEKESIFITDILKNGFSQISPKECGALTEATLITKDFKVYGDMNYQIESFLEELAKGNPVTWFIGD